jgi:ribosome-associated protein
MTLDQDTQRLLRREASFEFSRSSGPGGQNVNKVNSRVTLRWRPEDSQVISDAVKRRFVENYSARLTEAGEILISSGASREQKLNKDAVLKRLCQMLASVLRPPKKRVATKPGKAAKERRLKEKKQHSEKKRIRRGE